MNTSHNQLRSAYSLPEGFHEPAIRVTMLPRDTNKHGTVFGGVILSYLDLAGEIEARRHAPHKLFVTVAINGVEFIAPVFVGDLVSFFTKTSRIGRTSVTTDIFVEAVRDDTGERVRVMEAEAVYVAVDENRHPIPVKD
jgi:acyl-CoA thioesterase YciA